MATFSNPANPGRIEPRADVEPQLRVEVTVDTVNGRQAAIDAKFSGSLFRDIQKILACKSPEEVPDITQRICGVCPVPHGLASAVSLERAAGLVPPANARIMRNLVLGASYLQSHILHFYMLSLPDYIDAPSIPPRQPSWSGGKRISRDDVAGYINNYLVALEVRRKCQEMAAIFGGGAPSPPVWIPGGFTATPRLQRIEEFKALLSQVTAFIKDAYIPDVNKIAGAYQDYFSIGAGHRNLLAYGAFDLDETGKIKLLRRGRQSAGIAHLEAVEASVLTEHVTNSWYSLEVKGFGGGFNAPGFRPASREPHPWLKAPRYQQKPYEVGSLARMKINGDYTGGISVLDRLLARALETEKIAKAMGEWVDQLTPPQPVRRGWSVPVMGSGICLTEAPRGALGHWIKISAGKTVNYQIVTPTCWNASARDDRRNRGPIEEALIGTPVENLNEPLELVRVLHSFDPCLSCNLSVTKPAGPATIFRLC